MCQRCNYGNLLTTAGLEATAHRLRVLEAIGDSTFPLSAVAIHQSVAGRRAINRVTVYRILDTLVEHGVVERISTGGRAFNYGLAPNAHHQPHPHFYCTRCGRMRCLAPESLNVDSHPLWKTFPGRIDRIEVRVDGVCKNCLPLETQSRN